VRHFKRAEQVAVLVHKVVEARQVFFTDCGWRNDATDAGFEILKDFRFSERKFEFVAVENLKDQDLVAVVVDKKGDIQLSTLDVAARIATYYFYQSFLIFVHLSGVIPVVAAAFTLSLL
jgi:hypothetical protein